MEVHFKVIGTLLTLLAFLHAGFPRYFNWATEFAPLSLINRQMMYVHTLFIALLVLLSGLLCLGYAPDLVHTPLGRVVCLGMGIFWLLRLVVQFVGYSPQLWRGKRFETMVHVLFSLFWLYLTVVFLRVYWQ
ncbi:hypothetical protein [Hymenobacter swuensis]|uniref:Uncharacterized protein n=1 Tax=Hymenobacter swuensis DY53 TaxID=1227739 RepID=W8EUZ3_9BACT|nr:hypothetical protein [Hymenobacter swuensis]AHJ97024.1 hypothetical protein Hsw_1429 [Hymenobacter swuensis DY53]